MSPEQKWAKFLLYQVNKVPTTIKHKLSEEKKSKQVKNFRCDQCDHVFTQKANLKRHIEFLHDYENASFFKCEQCKLQYTTKDALKQHNLTKHSKIKLLCDQCEYSTSQNSYPTKF